MTSNPVETTHAAIVDQLIEEALSYEDSVQPGLGECLREAARLLEGLDAYVMGWEDEPPLVYQPVCEYPQPRHSYVDDYHV